MMVLDTSGLLAAIDGAQRRHADCARALTASRGPYLLSPFVLAELDYLLATRVGPAAQGALLDEVAGGTYRIEAFGAEDIQQARLVMQKYVDLQPGLADASIVVLAARYRIRDILTLDRRHFVPMRQLNGRPFRLLP